MKKAIISSTVGSMIKMFSMGDLDTLEELGYSVTIVANFKDGNTMNSKQMNEFVNSMKTRGVKVINSPISRNPFSIKNLQAYKEIKKMLNDPKLELVHTHSPIMSALVRLSANKDRKYKIIYTAHGFHFFKGSSLLNWLIYYPIEKLLTSKTDDLITINKEDYKRARKMASKKCKVHYFPGIGVEDKFYISNEKLQERLLKPQNKLNILSVGELNKNKNHKVVLQALSNVSFENFEYTICGRGPLMEEYEEFIKVNNLHEKVCLEGFVENIESIYFKSDLLILPSFREGMPKAMMEAMAAGLPVICSDIRGCRDVVTKENGILFSPDSMEELLEILEEINNKTIDLKLLGLNNFNLAEIFKKEKYLEAIKNIYSCSSDEDKF